MPGKPLAYFVAGTDTAVGKTLMGAALLAAASARGLSTVGIKPVAAGCTDAPDGLRCSDAQLLRQYSNLVMPYEMSNPVSLRLAEVPHLAAAQEGRRLDAGRLEGFCRAVLMKRAGLTLIEGTGGWLTPLNARQTLADLAVLLRLPVILVVGLRRGCINHALLTARAIHADGLSIAGWIACATDADMENPEASTQAIAERMSAPCLGSIPVLTHLGVEDRISDAVARLALDALLQPPLASTQSD